MMPVMPVCGRALRRPGLARLGVLSLVLRAPRGPRPGARMIFSETGVWEKDYLAETRRKVEQWWRPRIMEQWKEDPPQEDRKKFYVLSMFPTRRGGCTWVMCVCTPSATPWATSRG
ncbi:hypothetical protein CRUP_000264 [Coryphaenoides rupestris]|nr:hypothetical protein CRUP_000264 [Coryphaenoides rupestris]